MAVDILLLLCFNKSSITTLHSPHESFTNINNQSGAFNFQPFMPILIQISITSTSTGLKSQINKVYIVASVP